MAVSHGEAEDDGQARGGVVAQRFSPHASNVDVPHSDDSAGPNVEEGNLDRSAGALLDQLLREGMPHVDDEETRSDDEDEQSVTDWKKVAREFRAKHERTPPFLRITCGKKYSRENPKIVIFFFHYRVFRPWCWWKADIMFVNNFVAMISTIIALIEPDWHVNNVIGGLSLFGGNLLLHSWFGYMRYSESPWYELDPKSNDKELEPIRLNLAAMIHGGNPEQHSQKTQTLLSLPFTATNYLGYFVSVFGMYLAASCVCGERCAESELTAYIIYYVSLIMGSLFWPIVFSLVNRPAFKVIASFALFANEELYASYLFRKTTQEFCKGYLMAMLGDFMPLDDFPLLEDLGDNIPGGQGDGLQEIREDANDVFEEVNEFADQHIYGNDDEEQATNPQKAPKRQEKKKSGWFAFLRRDRETMADTNASNEHGNPVTFGQILGQAPTTPEVGAPSAVAAPVPQQVNIANGRNESATVPVAESTHTSETADEAQEENNEFAFSAEHPDPLLVVSLPILGLEQPTASSRTSQATQATSQKIKAKETSKSKKEKKSSRRTIDGVHESESERDQSENTESEATLVEAPSLPKPKDFDDTENDDNDK